MAGTAERQQAQRKRGWLESALRVGAAGGHSRRQGLARTCATLDTAAATQSAAAQRIVICWSCDALAVPAGGLPVPQS